MGPLDSQHRQFSLFSVTGVIVLNIHVMCGVLTLRLVEIDAPDPPKLCRSDRIRIQIQNTASLPTALGNILTCVQRIRNCKKDTVLQLLVPLEQI